MRVPSSLVGCLLVTITITFTFTGAVPHLDHHQLQLKEHYHHLEYIAEYPCHDPQPRVFSIHELFPVSETHNKAYFPDVTILHHCGASTGCCTSGKHCVTLHEDHVKLPFKVTFLEDFENHKKGSWIIQYYELVNHTQCACKDQLVTPTDYFLHPTPKPIVYQKPDLFKPMVYERRNQLEYTSSKPYIPYELITKPLKASEHWVDSSLLSESKDQNPRGTEYQDRNLVPSIKSAEKEQTSELDKVCKEEPEETKIVKSDDMDFERYFP